MEDKTTKEGKWSLSTEAMNAFVNRKLGDDGMPVFAIDVPDSDSEDKIHYAKIVVCGDQGLAQQLVDDHGTRQSLMTEREGYTQLLTVAKTLIRMNNCNYDRSVMREHGGFIELEKAVEAIESERSERSQSEWTNNN